MVTVLQSKIRCRSGFTLIEMLVVIVIIGILLAVSVPMITSLGRSTALQGAERQVSNAASLARQFAITHRVPTELRVNDTLNAVTILTNVGPNATGPNAIQIDKWNFLPIGTIIDMTVYPVSVYSSVSNIVFTPTGGTTNSQEVQILVREGSYENLKYFGTNSNCATVTVNSIVGRIAINRP